MIQMQQKQRIQQIQQMIQNMGMKLQVKRNDQPNKKILMNNSQKNSFKMLNSYLLQSQKSSKQRKSPKNHKQSNQNPKFKNLNLKNKQSLPKSRQQFNTPFEQSELHSITQSITQQIICKYNSIEPNNQLYIKKISQKDKEIFYYQQKIQLERKKNRKQLISRVYEQEEKKRENQENKRILEEERQMRQIYDGILRQISILLNFGAQENENEIIFTYEKNLLSFVSQIQQSYEQIKLKTPQPCYKYNCCPRKCEDDWPHQNSNNNRISSSINSSQIQNQNSFQVLKQNQFSSSGVVSNYNSQQKFKNPLVLFKPFAENLKRAEKNREDIKPANNGKNKTYKSLLNSKKKIDYQQTENQNNNKNSYVINDQKNGSDSIVPSKPCTVRHSRGLNTLITNMKIFQSYQKAMQRQDFLNQYQIQLVNGKRKKKTFIKNSLLS